VENETAHEIRIAQIKDNINSVGESKVLYSYISNDDNQNLFSDIDYETNNNVLFWSQQNLLYISVFNERSNKSNVINKSYNIKPISAISYDWIYNYIFFGNGFGVFITKIDKSNISYIISNITHTDIEGICVNPIDLFVIWSDFDTDGYNAKIYKARYDGSNKIPLVNKNISRPFSLAIDYTIKRIYWVNIFEGQLESVDYNGNESKLIYQSKKLRAISEIDLYNGFIYWSTVGSDNIYRINTIGAEFSEFTLYEHFSRKFKITHSSRQPNGSNLCVNTNCQYLCVPIAFSSYRCLCPDTNVYNLSESCEEYV